MDLNALIEQLNSLHDLDRLVARLIARGPEVIPLLEQFLLRGKPSVVYQPRRAAVEILGALGAKDVIAGYLRLNKEIPDLATRFAEQAVEDAAALELAAFRSADALEILLRIALPSPQPGMVEALGRFVCPDAIPYFIRALEDDFCRSAAEEALRALGRQTEMALVTSSRLALPSIEDERSSSKRRRVRSLELLAELGPSAETWPILRCFLRDSEPGAVVAVSKMAATVGDRDDRIIAVDRLLQVLPDADWYLRDEIKECLINLYPDARSQVEACIAQKSVLPEPERLMDLSLRVLLAVYHATAPGEGPNSAHESHS